ncbi:E3 SUMO-protein ligase PIAS3 isoform X2 [Diorhabda carinulata]|uniref:E3 SUMO-protein ligase PIAS3 isoform X2 n=1 Tax=Diorhabda carinulata TaxID=1163345 RepID=UPI0025A0168A|nr:E3 SUMO-protein ligase PIAS3 isoform X2 [Diorhabda carinulata]
MVRQPTQNVRSKRVRSLRRQSGALNVQPASNSPPTSEVPPGATVNNMSQTQGSMPRIAANVHPFSNDGRQMAMAPILRTRKLTDISDSKSGKIQQLPSRTKVKRKNKVSVEVKQHRLEQKRAAEKLRREKIRNDPETYKNYCQRERARNEKRKKEGKLKSIDQLSEREKRARRKQQNLWKKNSRARQTPMYQQSMYSPYPQYSTAKQQQNVLAGNYPIYPDVKFRRLPFYDVLADLLKPSSLVPQSNQRMQEGTFYFHLTPQQATDIASSRDIRPGVKCDYVKQVQMRFCLLETSCEQDDYFPPNVIVKVNNKLCPLPNPIPTNKPGVEPKRPPRPVNITQMVKLSPTVANTITVSWAADYGRGYAISVSLVHKLSSMDLLQRLKLKGVKNADHTRAIIKEKLNDDGDEIATTSLRVSLMCPLGKMRMTTPCRPLTCGHLQCFDASLFLQMNERKPTWSCPVCDKPALYDNLVIDGYFTEVLSSTLLSSECNEIQLNKDGTWCVQTPEKKCTKIEKPTVIGIDDSIEIIGDDIEIVSSNIAATSSTDKPAEVPKLEESRKKDIVDLTISDSEDEEPAAKVRAIAPKPDSTSISSSSNQSRVTTTPGPSSVSSSGYPASPSVINLDSPSPPHSPQQTPQPAPQQQTPSSCMMTGQTNGNSNQTNPPFMSPNSMPYLDLESEAAVGSITNITYPTSY